MRVTRIVAAVLAVGVAVGVAGCGGTPRPDGGPAALPGFPGSVAPAGAPAPDPGPRFTDPDGRFSLVPPPGWTIDPRPTGRLQLVLRAPGFDHLPDGAVHPVLTVVTSEIEARTGTYGLRAIADGAKQAARGRGDTILMDGPVTLADGLPAYLISAEKVDGSTGEVVHDLKLLTGDDRGTVMVEALSLAKDWGALEAAVVASLRTVRTH